MLNEFQDELKRCLQNEPAFCKAACPFDFDIVDYIDKLKKGSFQAAYRVYQNAVAFPGIVSQLCDQPCQNVCPRAKVDEAIALRELEQACLAYARDKKPYSFNLPPKPQRIAIIGGGPSGLACLLRLASRSYQVDLYEQKERIGGHLPHLLAAELIEEDLQRSLNGLKYQLHLNQKITNLDALEADAIYIATGRSSSDFGLSDETIGAYATNRMGVFRGGGLCGSNTIEAIADGLFAANAIERFLKVGRMDAEQPLKDTKIEMDMQRIDAQNRIRPEAGHLYSRGEAVEEAKRCLQCACDACIYHCDLMRVTGKYPRRIWEDVRITVHPGSLDKDATVAKRLISTCNQCGLCKEVCPQRIDVGSFLRRSHQTMHAQGNMPWAFHDFWLRDMEFSNQEAQLYYRPHSQENPRYLFFPGCQLGASDPFYPITAYRWLRQLEPATAILSQCCGAPASWAGDEDLCTEVMTRIRGVWQELGEPTLVLACPSCHLMLRRHLPELPLVMLYSLLAEHLDTIPAAAIVPEHAQLSIFDPCASRHLPQVQQAIRRMVDERGCQTVALSMEGQFAHCCSYGGQVSIASPVYAHNAAQRRISENELPYLVYCSNCRDVFLNEGKETLHILDLLFRPDYQSHKEDLPTVSQRRVNRIIAHNSILDEMGVVTVLEPADRIALHISDELKRKLDREKILETDLSDIIIDCEESGRKLEDPEKDCFIAHKMIGNMTFWVEYRPEGDGFRLLNAYGHRMRIVEV